MLQRCSRGCGTFCYEWYSNNNRLLLSNAFDEEVDDLVPFVTNEVQEMMRLLLSNCFQEEVEDVVPFFKNVLMKRMVTLLLSNGVQQWIEKERSSFRYKWTSWNDAELLCLILQVLKRIKMDKRYLLWQKVPVVSKCHDKYWFLWQKSNDWWDTDWWCV